MKFSSVGWLAMTMMVIAVLAIFAAVWLHSFLRQRTLRKRWETCRAWAEHFVQGVKLQYPGCESAINAVTTEVNLRTDRTRSTEITEEQWVGALDMIEPAKTPLLSFAESEVNLGAKEFKKNVDSFVGARGAVGRADNEAAPASGSSLSNDWTSNIRVIGNIAQGFSRKWSVGWIASRVPNIHGMANIENEGRRRAYAAMKLDQEVAIGSFDQVAVLDQGPNLGAIGAGYFKLIASANAYASVSAFAMGAATDLHSAPASAVITGALATVHTRAMWMNAALALRGAAQEDTDFMVFAGLNLNQAVSDLTNPTVQSTSASAGTLSKAADQVRVYLRQETDNILGVTVDTILTPNGRFFLAKSDWLGTTTTTSTGGALASVNVTSAQRASAAFVRNVSAGVIVKKGNLFKMWGITPFTETLGATGGGDDRDSKSLMAWGVRNPILAGALNFS